MLWYHPNNFSALWTFMKISRKAAKREKMKVLRKLLIPVVVLFALCLPIVGASINPQPVAYVSIESFDSIHGSGVIRVMAVRSDGTPAQGNTVVSLITPCSETVEVASIFVNFGRIDSGQTEDGHFFDFIIPNSGCHGRYTVTAVIADVTGVIEGGTTFKY